MPRPGKGSPRPVGDILGGLMGRRGLGGRRKQVEELARAWVEVAGDDIADQTRVRGVHRGTLTIEVASPPLCHELASFRRDELLIALKERLGNTDIQDIHFRLGAFD